MHTVRILGIETIAQGTVQIELEKPEGFVFRPGQFVTLALPHAAGGEEHGNARSMSLASAPSDPTLVIAMRIPEKASSFKEAVAVLKKGDRVTISDARGHFTLHEETEILHRLVEDLRTLSLAEAGELNLAPARERAALVLGRAAAAMVETAARAGVTLVTDLPASLPEINLDSDRIVQVLMNLLSNAIRHTPAGGEVRVAARVSGESLHVSVSDSGSGIPEEALPHVFDRFYRVDPSRSRDSGGSGLGLAIARQLVRMHGGDISAGNNDGAGASFGFTLPLSPSARQRRARQSAATPEPAGTTVLPTS